MMRTEFFRGTAQVEQLDATSAESIVMFGFFLNLLCSDELSKSLVVMGIFSVSLVIVGEENHRSRAATEAFSCSHSQS